MIRIAFRAPIAAAFVAIPAALAAQEPTVEEVLNRHYEAIGGIDAWEAVESMRMSGRMTMGQGMEAPFTLVSKRPNKARMEFTVQGMTGIQAFDGETAWMVMPFMGTSEPQRMPMDQAEALAEDSDFDGMLIDYEEKGHSIELAGMEQVDGTDAYLLDVTLAGGDVRHVYLDAESYVPIKITGRRAMQGTEIEFESILGDYRRIGDLLVAHSIENRAVGAPASQMMTIDSIAFDIPTPDSLFEMPPSGS